MSRGGWFYRTGLKTAGTEQKDLSLQGHLICKLRTERQNTSETSGRIGQGCLGVFLD